ncbi:pre-peptidase C-terminal domain-containing protein [Aliikangiella sp. IMCC44653]
MKINRNLLFKLIMLSFFVLPVSAKNQLNSLTADLNSSHQAGVTKKNEFVLIGDMLVKSDVQKLNFDSVKPEWTDGKVFYAFDDNVNEQQRASFVEATKIWESVAQLEFIERTTEPNYIHVRSDNKNYAVVGMVGGKQTLAMFDWGSLYIIVHEIGHSLGMWHEHMRSDRDSYVSIHEQNIDSTQAYNFAKRSTINYADYDHLSIMHYGLTAYTTNGERTISPLPEFEKYTPLIGHRSFISKSDQINAATRYGAKIIDFEDAHFKAYLVSQFDSNGDSEIDTIEAAKVTQITTPGNGQITSIEGIEFFRGVTHLNVSNENLSVIPKLPSRVEVLNVSNNQLENVDVSWGFVNLLVQIDASLNPLDVYSCDSVSFVHQTKSSQSLTINPLKDGSELDCSGDAIYRLLNAKPRQDLRSKGSQTYHINVPAGQSELVFETQLHNGVLGGEMDIYVAFNRTPTDTDFDFSSNNAGNMETVAVANPQAGVWYVTLIPVERSFESVDLSASYTESSVSENELVNGVRKTNLSANKSATLDFYIDVPNAAKDLSIAIQGGSGDADLYVQFAAAPSLSQYDCRPWKNGNTESCAFSQPESGRYYVQLHGYTDFSGVELIATYQLDNNPLPRDFKRFDLTANTGEWIYFSLTIPSGTSELNVAISGGTGDADLYLNPSYSPAESRYVCRPYLNGNNEACVVNAPTEGEWIIGIKAYNSFSGLSLEATW